MARFFLCCEKKVSSRTLWRKKGAGCYSFAPSKSVIFNRAWLGVLFFSFTHGSQAENEVYPVYLIFIMKFQSLFRSVLCWAGNKKLLQSTAITNIICQNYSHPTTMTPVKNSVLFFGVRQRNRETKSTRQSFWTDIFFLLSAIQRTCRICKCVSLWNFSKIGKLEC